MRADAHISTSHTEVRGGMLTRHLARRYENGRVFAVSTGLGMPRTWSYSASATLEGFEKGLEETKDQDGLPRLRAALATARATLAARCDDLVERLLPDATLLAVLLVQGELHVMSVGAGRVYLQRRGRPKRLTSRDEVNGGLLRARPCECSSPIEPGDLVLAGSVTAFSTSSIARAVSVLAADPETTPAVLASLLTEPATKAGVGAAALVLRMR